VSDQSSPEDARSADTPEIEPLQRVTGAWNRLALETGRLVLFGLAALVLLTIVVTLGGVGQ